MLVIGYFGQRQRLGESHHAILAAAKTKFRQSLLWAFGSAYRFEVSKNREGKSMVSEFHNTLLGLVCRAQAVEKELASITQTEDPHGINPLDELQSKRFQAEEVMRTTDYEGVGSSPDFCALVQQIASDLTREIEECEKLCASPDEASRK